jgi:hypothetical protein
VGIPQQILVGARPRLASDHFYTSARFLAEQACRHHRCRVDFREGAAGSETARKRAYASHDVFEAAPLSIRDALSSDGSQLLISFRSEAARFHIGAACRTIAASTGDKHPP